MKHFHITTPEFWLRIQEHTDFALDLRAQIVWIRRHPQAGAYRKADFDKLTAHLARYLETT